MHWVLDWDSLVLDLSLKFFIQDSLLLLATKLLTGSLNTSQRNHKMIPSYLARLSNQRIVRASLFDDVSNKMFLSVVRR